jgi:2-polyprenyl-3-methyl-5-hydroxy-6-metoxy-1,4-benzoquinol methylase
MTDIDFGTYHHSTPEKSKRIRESAEKAFSKLLRPLYPSRAALTILDAGCGLGFLTYVAAKRFPKATVSKRGGARQQASQCSSRAWRDLAII